MRGCTEVTVPRQVTFEFTSQESATASSRREPLAAARWYAAEMADAPQPPSAVPGLNLPPEVIGYIRSVFAAVNRRTSGRLSSMPTVHEQELDGSFIEAVRDNGRPTQVATGWTVQIQTHFLGGMRHWPDFSPRWEIADIGVLVMLRAGGRLKVTKAAGLQSKRLYPVEQDHEEDEPADYQIGFARLYRDERTPPALLGSRTFTLETSSRYRALEIPGPQHERIGHHQEAQGKRI
jgi:hypothetical protein